MSEERLDVHYHRKNLLKLTDELESYTPDEYRRFLGVLINVSKPVNTRTPNSIDLIGTKALNGETIPTPNPNAKVLEIVENELKEVEEYEKLRISDIPLYQYEEILTKIKSILQNRSK